MDPDQTNGNYGRDYNPDQRVHRGVHDVERVEAFRAPEYEVTV
jgi:hypothetical protein